MARKNPFYEATHKKPSTDEDNFLEITPDENDIEKIDIPDPEDLEIL